MGSTGAPNPSARATVAPSTMMARPAQSAMQAATRSGGASKSNGI
jgi:hypothetical protein